MSQFTTKGIGVLSTALRKAESHKLYVENSSTDAIKPRDFIKDIKWIDWAPSFKNYLRAIPGRTGAPLSYVIRDNETPEPNPVPNEDFLDDYILNAPLTGLTTRQIVGQCTLKLLH